MYSIPTSYKEELEKYKSYTNRALNNSIDEVQFKIYRVVRGIYEQRTKGTFMVRIRCTAGIITPGQLIKVSEIAERYNSSTIHITTRQEIQLHNLKLQDTPSVLNELYDTGLSTKGSGGNTVRNITASIESGTSTKDIFDVTPYNIALTNFLINHEKSFDLPRKLKIAFSSSKADSALAAFNDLGFIANIKNSEKGFKVYLGGSPSVKPMVGEVLFEFLPADKIFGVALAVIEMFNIHGNRKNRHKARLRYLFYKLDKDKVIGLFNETFNQFKNNTFEPITDIQTETDTSKSIKPETKKENDFKKWFDDYVISQQQKGLFSVEIPVMHGNLTMEQTKTIAEFAEHFGNDTIRFSRRQNLHLRNIPEEYLVSLFNILKDKGLEVTKPYLLGNLVSCTGADTCQLGICFSKGGLQSIYDKLEENNSLQNLKDISINISGCPNSCGQHLVADLGFAGKVSRNGKIYPSYNVFAGAVIGDDKASLPIQIGEVAAKDLPEFTNSILTLYKEIGNNSNFREFVETKSEEVENIVNQYKKIPSFEENQKYYIDWGNNDLFTLKARGGGECSAGLLDLIESEIKVIEKCKESFSGQQEIEEQTILLHEMILSASKLLCLTLQKQFTDEKILFESVQTDFISNGKLSKNFSDIFKLVIDGDFVSIIKQTQLVLLYADSALKYYKGLDDSLNIKIEVKEINAPELKALIDKKDEIKIIDVRETWEKEIADIGGELIPLGNIEANLAKIPKNIKTVIYCRTGRRSAEAINLIAKIRNTQNLYNLKGGIHAWADEVNNTIQKY